VRRCEKPQYGLSSLGLELHLCLGPFPGLSLCCGESPAQPSALLDQAPLPSPMGCLSITTHPDTQLSLVTTAARRWPSPSPGHTSVNICYRYPHSGHINLKYIVNDMNADFLAPLFILNSAHSIQQSLLQLLVWLCFPRNKTLEVNLIMTF